MFFCSPLLKDLAGVFFYFFGIHFQKVGVGGNYFLFKLFSPFVFSYFFCPLLKGLVGGRIGPLSACPAWHWPSSSRSQSTNPNFLAKTNEIFLHHQDQVIFFVMFRLTLSLKICKCWHQLNSGWTSHMLPHYQKSCSYQSMIVLTILQIIFSPEFKISQFLVE